MVGQCGSRYFPFHVHLIEMECRRDILFENQFINARNRVKKGWRVRLVEKLKTNKIRILYLTGFMILFNLGSLYDSTLQPYEAVFSSTTYRKMMNYLLKDRSTQSLKQQHDTKIDVADENNILLANSFRRYDICLEKDGLLKEITWRRLAKDMQMEMMEKEIMMEKEYVTVGEFIKTVRERGLVVEDVQKRLANSCYYF